MSTDEVRQDTYLTPVPGPSPRSKDPYQIEQNLQTTIASPARNEIMMRLLTAVRK